MATQAVQEVMEEIKRVKSLGELEAKSESFYKPDGHADRVAREFGEKLKPTQLRKVFHELRTIARPIVRTSDRASAAFDRTKLVRLMPTLAYGVGRDVIPKDFYNLMKLCLERVKTDQDLKWLDEFITSLLAYHKYHVEEKKRRE